MGWYGDYKPYVPVAQRRAQAAREVAKRIKKGEAIIPVQIEGRTIAATFWGKAWCSNLESYSDYSNRLPRGRTYVRNGSVVHLAIEPGQIRALVSGSSLYQIQIDILPLNRGDWQALKRRCAGQVGSLVELLQGKISQAVMEQVTNRDHGLFPKPQEIQMRCSCPDGVGMCKHLAAVMYGVGNRLDSAPELLFRLRGVNQNELIEQAIPTAPPTSRANAPQLAVDDLGSIFGIEIGDDPVAPPVSPPKPRSAQKPAPSSRPVEPPRQVKAAPTRQAPPAQVQTTKVAAKVTKPAPAQQVKAQQVKPVALPHKPTSTPQPGAKPSFSTLR